MPPRRTRKKTANSAPRRSKKGNHSAFLIVLLIFFVCLSGAGFYLLNQERDRNQSVAVKAQKIAKENPDAEVFTGDVDVKKK
jgi:lipopolysaccharide export system protein LptA